MVPANLDMLDIWSVGSAWGSRPVGGQDTCGGAGEGAALGGKWLHEAQDTAGLRKEFLRQLLDPKASTEMKALPGLARRKDRAS